MEGDGTSATPPHHPPDCSPSATPPPPPPAGDMIVKRLCGLGVPMHYMDSMEMGLVQFVKENKGLLQNIVSVLMPGAEEVQLLGSGEAKRAWHEYKQGCREGIRWAQWLIFGGNPEEIMNGIQKDTGHVRGVCGAVWGSIDIAYRCRTCENDPTCAICVACFEPAKHVNHDYLMIHTGRGCCDCGDITAWKESGFCSRHSGMGEPPSLSEDLMSTFQPVMEALLNEWAKRLQAAASCLGGFVINSSDQVIEGVATQTSSALVDMLLSFCNCSESLLTCTGSLIACDKVGLLDLFLKSECFLSAKALSKLHELLFKLMGSPNFKLQFAKTFIHHYPLFIRDGLRQNLESTNGRGSRESAALSNFPVQIFTVPSLTLQLVLDQKLLDMLFEALKDAFLSCSGGDGQQLASKGQAIADFYCRIIDDIRFVLGHPEVANYVARERLDLLKAWLHLLAFTQGMDSQRRQTSIHVEEETENWFTAYLMEVQMAGIHPLLIDGVAKINSSLPVDESLTHGWTVDEDAVHGHAKIGKTSMESDVSGKVGTSNSLSHMDVDSGAIGLVGQGDSHFSTDGLLAPVSSRAPGVPAVLLWLIAECAKVLDIWFLLDAYRETAKSSRPSVQKGGFIQRRGIHFRGRGGRTTLRGSGPALDNAEGEGLDAEVDSMRESTFREWLRLNGRVELGGAQDNTGGVRPFSENIEVVGASSHLKMQGGRECENGSTDWWMGAELPLSGVSAEFLQRDTEWLEIDFDVTQQEVSFHIPLHRFLAVALQKSLETSPNLNHKEGNKRSWHSQDHLVSEKGFLLQLFPPCYHVPAFVSCLMEHPLRIQVFCAQVSAGMWRRNGRSVQALSEHYHSVKWCVGSLDLDLFLLQCCGVMAPTEEFVERIVSRFGLTEYFSLFLLRPNEYETTLAQHMLTLLIRIVVERGFCGFSATQACRRELIKRLAISDATHSQLMKSLPSRLHENKDWQEVLLSVATFYKPSGMQQGRFSLRHECWEELDLYHPGWNARELQSAEDRFLRACKVSSVIKQLPQWQKPFAPFQNLSRLATCKRVHDILRSIFFHAVFSDKISESRAPENVLITALHLLALGLDVCSLFAYKKGSEYKSGSFQSETSSSVQDAQEPPPLLGNATERVYFGGVDDTEISNRQSLLSLLVLLMRRYGENEVQGAAGESQLCSIGALIKSLLEKFSNLHSGCMYEIESLAPEILHRVSSRQDDEADSVTNAEKPGLSEADKKKLLIRERQAAVMAKMKAAQEKFAASFLSSQENSDRDKERPQSKIPGSRSQNEQRRQSPFAVVCALCRDSSSNSPTSFLTFVQRSRLLEIFEKGVPSWERRDRSKSVEAVSVNEEVDNGSSVVDSEVQESQIRVELLNLIQMALNGEVDREGPIEVEALLEFLGDEGFTESIEGSQSSVDARMSESTSSDSGSEDSAEEENMITSSDLPNAFLEYPGTAGDEDEKAKTRQRFLIAVLLEYADTLSKRRKQQQQLETENSATSQRQSLSRLSHTNATEGLLHDYVGSNDSVGVHMSSCGHAVHQECLDRYLSSLLQRYHSRTLFEGLQIVDPNQGEFLCPVCRRLANSVLPYISETSSPHAVGEEQATSVANGPQSPPGAFPLGLVSQVPQAMHLLCNAEELAWLSGFRKAVSRPLSKTLKSTFDSLFWRLYGLYFTGRESNSRHNCNRVSQSLLLWNVFRYTIISVELASRTREDALMLNSENNIQALWKSTEKGCVLPVLLRAAKAIQNQNRQSLLLRARGMQLLVGSVCFGVSKDSMAEPSMPGKVLNFLQYIDNGRETADIYLWRRTADPVLAHDPFSSLFWIVFCLPVSIPSSMEPFVSLVHLLYLVCVIQIIAFMGDVVLSDLSELQLTSSACVFLQTMLTNLKGISLFQTLKYQTSANLSGPILLAIRRLTLPYLRRCALLGKLLCDVTFEKSNCETVRTHDFVTAQKAVDWINNENREAISDAFEDLKELEVLEQKFSLPSLRTILEREGNQEVVLRWCNHLSKEWGPRKLVPVPRPTMAAPFKLMDLPPLYQTLLQRYIKERCPECSNVPEQPALCLLCGTLCCATGHRSCCSKNRKSECYRHAVACNGGVGVFLMIKKTNILLQRCARLAYWPSPYLDSFGEEDLDMNRGKPLYLNEERYAALTKMVVSHGLDHSSLVLSNTTWETVVRV
eukprot:c13921_g1_i1 orf=503-7018(-)